MSYSRFNGTNQVYVFMHVGGFLECCGCILQEGTWSEDGPFGGYFEVADDAIPNRFDSTKGMIEHLQLHREAGHTIPDNIEVRLLDDDERNFGESVSDD